MKHVLLSAPALSQPDFAKQFYIVIDSSTIGIAGYLCQGPIEEQDIITYVSRTLRVHERKYSVTELEFLAVIYTVTKFHEYLSGQHFLIYSDHQCLIYLSSCKLFNNRIHHWALKLQDYYFTIVYIPRKANIPADILSRNPSGFDGKEHLVTLTLHDVWNIDINYSLNPTIAAISGKFAQSEDQIIQERDRHFRKKDQLRRERCWKKFISDAEKANVMKRFHDETVHFGIRRKIWLSIRKYMYWKSIRRDVQVYVNNCSHYKETKPDLGSIKKCEYYITSQYPLQLTSVVIIGRLPRSRTFKYILSIVDYTPNL